MSTSKHDLTHERIVSTAAKALRTSGFEGVGVAEVMKAVGLTHGGFYAHFKSRDALLTEAIEAAGLQSRQTMSKHIQVTGKTPFRSLIETYLSVEHLTAVDEGCPLAACCAEIPRQAAGVRRAARQQVDGLVDMVRRALPKCSESDAFIIASTLIGAIGLARALGDLPRAQKALAASRKSLLTQFEA